MFSFLETSKSSQDYNTVAIVSVTLKKKNVKTWIIIGAYTKTIASAIETVFVTEAIIFISESSNDNWLEEVIYVYIAKAIISNLKYIRL